MFNKKAQKQVYKLPFKPSRPSYADIQNQLAKRNTKLEKERELPKSQLNDQLYLAYAAQHLDQSLKVKLVLLILLGCCINAAIANCEPPSGSYLKTCDVYGTKYISSDVNLRSLDMCKFDISCKNLYGKTKGTQFFLPNEMKNCLSHMENCDGTLILRQPGNDNICTSPDIAEKEGRRNYLSPSGRRDEL